MLDQPKAIISILNWELEIWFGRLGARRDG